MPGSHPLTSFSSNASSSLAGMGSLGGSGGSMPLTHAGSLGGSGPGANAISMPGSMGGGSYGGAGSFPGSQGGSPKAAYGSLGGFGPAGSAPLYKSGSLSSLGAPAPGSMGGSSAGGAVAAGGYSSDGGAASRGGNASAGGNLGGFSSAPLAAVAGRHLAPGVCMRHTTIWSQDCRVSTPYTHVPLPGALAVWQSLRAAACYLSRDGPERAGIISVAHSASARLIQYKYKTTTIQYNYRWVWRVLSLGLPCAVSEGMSDGRL